MFSLVKEQKSGIIAGIVASAVFMYFIDPILNSLSFLFITGSRALGDAYINRLYSQVALLDTLNYGFFFYSLLLIIFIFIAIGTVVGVTKSWAKSSKASTLHAVAGSDEQSQGKSTEETEPKNNARKKALPFAMLVLLLVAACALSSLIVSNFIQNSLVTSFKQHIRIVAPYITEQDKKLLMSEWSQMDTEADYVAVYKKLKTIAEKNELELPSNKIYSLTSI